MGENGSAPAVTVVLPVWSAEATIAEAVDSVLRQTMPVFELLVIDDGSVDGTAAILGVLSDPRVRVITHARRRGLVESLNEAVGLATADLIARMDADDIAAEERLARQCAVFARQPDVGLVATAYMEVDADGHAVGYRGVPASHGAAWFELGFGNCLAHPTVMFRRDAFIAAGGYRQDEYPAEDYGLWLRMVEHTRIATVPSVELTRRLSSASVSARASDAQRDRTIELASRALARLTGAHVSPSVAASLAGYTPAPDGRTAYEAARIVTAAWRAVRQECRRRELPVQGLTDSLARMLVRSGFGRSNGALARARLACMHPWVFLRLLGREARRAAPCRTGSARDVITG